MNIKEIYNLIEELKSKKYSTDSPENYQEFYTLAKKVIHGDRSILTVPYESKTLNLYRGRKNIKEKLFYNFGDLWYPPKELTSMQRFNLKKLPMFYAGSGSSTILIELKPKDGETYTVINVDLDTPQLKCVQLVQEELGNILASMDPVKKAAFQYIIDEARKYVEDDRPQDYYATQIFTQSIRDTGYEHFDAIAYNSVATSLKGYNFAIKPEFIDLHYIFNSAQVVKIYDYKSKEDFKIKCLYNCDRINSYGRLTYKPVELCDGHHISLSNFKHDKAV